jgi:Flp pilus assembly protein TadG
MYRFLRDDLRRLGRDERGNIFILFGALLIPLVLIMGGAVDLTRYARYKADLSNVVDAAALALTRQHDDYDSEQARAFIEQYVTAHGVADNAFTVNTVEVEKLANGFHVDVDASMKTTFLPLGKFTKNGIGITNMDMSIVSEVIDSSNRVEVALVLDNTGSMTSSAGSNSCDKEKTRMAGVRCAAKTLVQKLMPLNTTSEPDMVKIGLVPFEGSVNINNEDFSESWIDKGTYNSSAKLYFANAQYNGVNFNAPASGKRVSHYSLWDAMKTRTGLEWAGCVEMRAGTYELSVAPPSTGDSLYVQMFWPDEPDISTYKVGRKSYDQIYYNNYLDDIDTSSREARQRDYTKYTGISKNTKWGKSATTYPQTSGPNRGCPLPIVPLTTDQSRLETQIEKMTPNGATGTYIPAGLLWGWNVVDPGIPFTEGVKPGDEYYDQTVKAVVLLTDGENSVTYFDSDNNHNQSPYSAFGYINPTGRLDNSSESKANESLDTKTSTLCTNMKTAKVRVYTIIFGSVGTATQTLMKNCATVSEGESLFYQAPTSSELETIFDKIGKDLTKLHLSM